MAHTPLQKYRAKSNFRTICKIHKELYELIKDRPEAVRLLEEAYDCGIRMNNKLYEYAEKQWKKEILERDDK